MVRVVKPVVNGSLGGAKGFNIKINLDVIFPVFHGRGERYFLVVFWDCDSEGIFKFGTVWFEPVNFSISVNYVVGVVEEVIIEFHE